MVKNQQKQKRSRRDGKNTQKSCKKDLNDPDNHNDVVSHSESDNLECELKWALGSSAVNNASGSDVIPAELF